MADAGAAVAAAIANAIKASGVVVRIEPQDFVSILRKIDKPLIVYTQGRLFSRNHRYLTSYKGFAFFTMQRDSNRSFGKRERFAGLKLRQERDVHSTPFASKSQSSEGAI